MKKATFIYVIGREEGPIKVGITQNPNGRLQTIQTGCSYPVEILHCAMCRNREHARKHERNFHSIYSEHRLSGEWFDLDGYEAVDGVKTAFDIEEYFEHQAELEAGRLNA